MSPSDGQVGIHIVSDPETTRIEEPQTEEAREVTSMPLRLLVAADLAPGSEDDVPLWRVDRHSFAGVLERVTPTLSFDVANRMSDQPRLLEVDLAFASLNDFRPKRIVQQVPVLARLYEMREGVRQVQAQEIDLDAFRQRLQEAGVEKERVEELHALLDVHAAKGASSSKRRRTTEPKNEGDDALDRLLGMVDAGDDEPESETTSPDGLVGALVGAASGDASSQPKERATAAARLLDDLDQTLGHQLNAIIGHPALRRLEAAWRGLKLLVDRIDFRAGIELEVLPVDQAGLDDALYQHVLLPEHEGTDKAPLSAIILDVAFTNSRDDLGLLEELASTAASLQVPMIGSVSPAFFGLEQEAGLSRLPLVGQHLDGPEYIAWRKLRETDQAQYLTLTVPRFLLRYPYGVDQPADGIVFEEEGQLWGHGSLLAGVAIADSFARTGSSAHVRNRPIEDLPLWQGAQGATPLAATLATDKQRELADAGFAVLTARRDAVHLAHAPSIKRPPTMDDALATREARLHASLPCQLFVARAAHLLLQLERGVEPGTPVEEAREMVADRFRRWLGTAGEEGDEAVRVEHIEQAQAPEHDLLAVRLQPPKHMLEDTVRLVLAFRLQRAVGARTEEPPAQEQP